MSQEGEGPVRALSKARTLGFMGPNGGFQIEKQHDLIFLSLRSLWCGEEEITGESRRDRMEAVLVLRGWDDGVNHYRVLSLRW